MKLRAIIAISGGGQAAARRLPQLTVPARPASLWRGGEAGSSSLLAARIFTHSLRQLTANLIPALQISLVPTLLQYALIFGMTRASFPDPAKLEAAIEAGQPPLVPLLAISLISLFCGTWMAVAWHRFVLMNELPQGWLPRVHGERMLAYLGRSLLLGLAIVGVELAVGFALVLAIGLLGAIARPLAVLVGIVGGVALLSVLVTAFLRLSLMLPAAALGEGSSLRMAWMATRGQNLTLFALALMVVAGLVAVSLPQFFFAALGLMILAFACQVAAGWAAVLMLLSVFTTLYGHYVERRPLA